MIRSFSLNVPYQTTFTDGGHAGVADLPVAMGGAGKGFGPLDLLEAAFATCLTTTVQMYAAKHSLPLAGVQCEVRIDRSVQGAATLHYALRSTARCRPSRRPNCGTPPAGARSPRR